MNSTVGFRGVLYNTSIRNVVKPILKGLLKYRFEINKF